jgi:hypothetical protein
MAVDGGFLGNGTNGIGQGLAFVLPTSTTEKYAMQLGQQRAAEARAMALAQQKRQQELVGQYQKDFASAKLPEYWATAGKPINEAFTKYQTDAANYMAQTGKNPYSNPEFIKQYNDTVLLPARQSKEIEQVGEKLIPMIAADHDNRFTEGSKQEVLKWWETAQKDPKSVLGKPAPQLQGTPSGIQDFYKEIKPVSFKNDNGTVSTTAADRSAMQSQAYEISNDPRWNNLKKTQYGIDPDLGDIGGVFDKNGKRVWYTNPKATEYIAQTVLENPNEPHNAGIITKLNIRPDDPFAVQKIQEAVIKQNRGYGKFISDAGKFGESLVSKSRDYKPPFTPYQLFQMDWKKSHPTGEKAPSEPTYFQDLSERMRNGVAGSGEELGSIFANNPAYLNAPSMNFVGKDKVKITIPAQYKTDVSKLKNYKEGDHIPANADRVLVEKEHTFTLDKTKPNEFTNTMAQIYKLGTGESVTPSKASTTSGKGKVAGGMSPVGKTTAGASPVNKNKKAATDYGL